MRGWTVEVPRLSRPPTVAPTQLFGLSAQKVMIACMASAEAATGVGMTGLRHLATILVAAGHFYIAGDGRIFVYGLPQ